MSKMGISTVQSYHGAQVFEAIGLNHDVHRRYFTWTASRIGGIGLDVIAEEVAQRHARAFPERPLPTAASSRAASTSTAATASTTCSTPRRIHKLQHACRTGNYERLQAVLAPDRRPVDDTCARCAA